MRKLDLRPPGSWQEEQDEKARQEWRRKHDPGPPRPRCDECGQPACYGRGDFGRPTDTPEHFCSRHAPPSLKRPGDFL